MRTFSTRNTIILLIALNIVAIGGYGFVLWQVVKQSERVNTVLENLAYEIDREATLQSLSRLVEDVENDKLLVDSQFVAPGEDSVVAYIKMIESLSRCTPVALSIESVEAGGSTNEGTGTVLIRVVASGSKTAVAKLIALIETVPIVTTVDSVSMNITQLESGVESWDASLTIRALVRS